jgi:hypothetical protein
LNLFTRRLTPADSPIDAARLAPEKPVPHRPAASTTLRILRAEGLNVKRSKEPVDDLPFHADMGTWFFVPDTIEQDRRAVELFKAFKYDIRDPAHWRWLLDKFFDLHFGTKGKGRPPKWTKEAYNKMWQHLFFLEHELISGDDGLIEFSRKEIPRSPRKQAALLKKTHPDDPLYKNSSEDEIIRIC